VIGLHITCLYCDLKWEAHVYTKESIDRIRCAKCGDKNLKVKDLSSYKINTYEGAPEFITKPEIEWGPTD
jgi:Zn finger protein HypA/HybF involved in hydrogenase expression